MDARQLIQSIMQQTTVLIGQLATSAGLRAPLATLADQVFLDLAREIERQGVTKNVVADMFGITLRSYQKKVQRLRAGRTDADKTLWQLVLEYIRANGGATRQHLLVAFKSDEPRDVIAVLGDLVSSGLLYSTGRGQHAAYRVTPIEDQEALYHEHGLETLLHLVWLQIATGTGATREAVYERFPGREQEVDTVLQKLIARGNVREGLRDGQPLLTTETVVIPVGSEAGWEPAVLDHFQAVCATIASKLRQGGPAADRPDLIGGTTLSFDLCPGHPHEAEAKALLARVRKEVESTWTKVSEHNRSHPDDRQRTTTKLVFYFGQNLIEDTDELSRAPITLEGA